MGKTPPQKPPPVATRTRKASNLHPPRRHIIRACAKHGNHASFIPIRRLSLEQFPEDLRTGAVLQLVHNLSQWVVRVRVTVSSRIRGGTGRTRAGCLSRTCTGLATSVGEDSVTVMVPLHVVRDDEEALHITADFFYDNEDDSDVITVKGKSLSRHNLQHVAQLTCDGRPELGHRFGRSKGKTAVDTLVLTEHVNVDLAKMSESEVAVLICHPHGFSKRVTVGDFCGYGELETVNDCEETPKTSVNALTNISTSSPCRMLTSSTIATSVSSSSSSVSSSSVSQSSSLLSSQSSLSTGSSSVRIDDKSVNDNKLIDDSESPVASQISPPSSDDNNENDDDETMTLSQNNEDELESKNKPVDAASEICKSVLSICKFVYRYLVRLRQRVCNSQARVPRRVVSVHHSAASCSGSSGGTLLLIGRRVWAGLNKTLTSLPVFLHVGAMSDRKRNQGVAVPVVFNDKALCSYLM